MITVLQWACAAVAGVVVLVITINAVYMLISPRAWFRLPELLRLNGSLTKKKYSEGLGADTVRLLGAILLSGVGWALYHFFSGNR
jgi:hypothetical protein